MLKRIGVFFIIALFICSSAFPDKLGIPFQCYPKQVQEKFAKHNMKLDLRAEDRTEDSWGFLVSEGSNYYLYSYNSVKIPEELELIQKIIMKE